MKRHDAGRVFHLFFHRRMTRFLITIAALLISVNAYAATDNLPDCSQSTVQNAIDSMSNGDVIVCPAGSWSWSSVRITKNITLQGAGIGNTNITITADNGFQSPSSYGGAFRVTGFTFKGANANFANYTNAMMAVYNGLGFRIDHNEFQSRSTGIAGSGGNVLHVRYNAGGVVDHNRFLAEDAGGGVCSHGMVLFSNSGTTSTSNNDQKYSFLHFDSNDVLGVDPTHTLFVEDNYFYNNQDCDSHNVHAGYGRHGGVAVFRHNEIHFMNIDNHGFRAEHAGFAMAIYNNTWVRDVSGIDLYLQVNIRGGTAVVYNNTVTGSTGSIGHGINLWYERATSGPGSSSVTINLPGYGTVSANTSCSSNEGNPCAEQPGTGYHGGSTRASIRDPMYFWNNTNFAPFTNETGETYIQSGRDYFNNQGAKPGYVEYPYPHPLVTGEPGPPAPSPGLIPSPPSIIGVN